MSLPEVLLWQALRSRPGGHRFRRQFSIEPITVDFVCLARRLVIEVDGEAHNRGDQPQRDAARDALLESKGFSVLRIAAEDVLSNLDGIVSGIVARCRELEPVPHGGRSERKST